MKRHLFALIACAVTACEPADFEATGGDDAVDDDSEEVGGRDASAPRRDAMPPDEDEPANPSGTQPQPAPTPPQTYVVTSLADPNPALFPWSPDPCNAQGRLTPGTLRHAIAAANSNANVDTIQITVAGDIELSSFCKGLTIKQPVFLNSRSDTFIKGTAMGPGTFLTVDVASAAAAPVIATQLNLSGGTSQRGIEVRHGTLDLQHGAVRNMSIAGSGAGIWVSNKLGAVASLALRHTLIEENHAINGASGVGGGIWFESAGTLTIDGSLLRNNTSAAAGGGLSYAAAPGAPPCIVADTTITGNSASDGGGITVATAAAITIRNSTISHNFSHTNSAAGISVQAGANLTLDFVTLNENVAESPYVGNAIYVKGAASVAVNRSLLIGKSLCGGPGVGSLAGSNNVTGDLTCPLTGIANVTAVIGFLANNGGNCGGAQFPCLTNAVPAGHPAIDASSQCTGVTFDQRGVTRTGPLCWAGAYEN